MKRIILFLCSLFTIGMVGHSQSPKIKKGKMYNGFTLVEKKFVKEIDAECLYFTHNKSGARLLKIVKDDANKLFGIAFKTVPEDDCGTPHILEHSVLNGSKNFPVKSPFDQLAQGSLNTFLNAMTNSDWTMYPVASMNEKDYFNLMHVYLDAVFNPLIYSDKRIFMQEGWHYELADSTEPIEYKGVVYNEMKGAYSSPSRELYHQRSKILFPDNGYGKDAGGYPSEITKLTYENFINFHKKYYHPDNSYILLYGNADIEKELAFIDKEYLSNYNKSNNKIEIPVQKPFATTKTEVRPYAVADDEDTNNKTYLSLSYVAGLNADLKLTWALQVLADALVNHEEGPIRRALLEAEIGQNVEAWLDDMQQNVFEIQVQNANEADQEKLREIVNTTLQKVVVDGLDKEVVNGIVNRIEFTLREGNTPQKGLIYFFVTIRSWMFTQNPFVGLEYEPALAELKKSINNGYLQEVIKQYLLNNPHSLSLALVPKQGLQKELNEATEQELATYKQSLKPEELTALVNETKALIAYQQREDDPSLKATIPSLEISDVEKTAEWLDVEEKKIEGLKTLHFNEFSNGIVYTNLLFDTRNITTQEIGWIQLLSEVLGKMPTEKYSFGELENAQNNLTGSFSTTFTWYVKDRNDASILPKFRVSSKAMADKTNQMVDLMAEVITKTRYNDFERLKELLTRHQAEVEESVKQNGMGIAQTRLFSYFSNEGKIQEIKSGIEYYRFITNLNTNFDTEKESIATKLSQIAQDIFTQSNLTTTITCNSELYPAYEKSVASLVKTLPSTNKPLNDWNLLQNSATTNEGIQTTSKVQYVVQGANFKQLGYDWSGQMRVLQQLLSTDYLQTQVRVIGGAYGGFARFAPSGNVYFGSYRDPNMKETLNAYAGIPNYIDSLNLDDKALSRFIIGTIATMDKPLTTSQKGERAFVYHLSGMTKELVQKERTEILNTSLADIKAFNPMLKAILNENKFCVYGNDQKIQAEPTLFNKLIKLEK